jgi:signal transduction histidine kinase
MTAYELLKRTPVRLAIAFTALFAVTVIALFAGLYGSLAHELEKRIRSNVEQTMETLHAIDRERGFDDLEAVVASESNSVRDIGTILLLLDEKGAYAAGNVRNVEMFDGWRLINRDSLELLGNGKRHSGDHFHAIWTPVTKGSLLVGGSDREIRQIQRQLLRGLAWALAATVALASAGATILAWRTQRRINLIGSTLSAVSRGKIESRVPLTGSDDDIDHVAAQINRTLGQLQNLIENVSQASSNIAHDLKKPMGRLRQRLDQARREATSMDEFRDAADKMLVEIDSIVDTFEALLRITEIEVGTRKARFAVLDLRAVLRDVADVYEAVVEDSGGTWRSDLDGPGAADIWGDRELLVQLFANLIENAIRHGHPKTRISLELTEGRDSLTATVADNGPGIPAPERAKVFRRLYRLEQSRTTEGSGLGLTLVAAIADLHSAIVQLGDNEPGLRVAIRFPRSLG